MEPPPFSGTCNPPFESSDSSLQHLFDYAAAAAHYDDPFDLSSDLMMIQDSGNDYQDFGAEVQNVGEDYHDFIAEGDHVGNNFRGFTAEVQDAGDDYQDFGADEAQQEDWRPLGLSSAPDPGIESPQSSCYSTELQSVSDCMIDGSPKCD